MVHAMLVDEEIGELTSQIPICAECGEDLDDKHKSMNLVSINQIPYFKVQRRCTNCGEENLYYRDMQFNALDPDDLDIQHEIQNICIE